MSEIAAGLIHDELPESSYVLPQLAQDEIGPVAPDILLVGRVFRRWQSFARRIGIDQRPIGVLAVLVSIAEQELAKRHPVAVGDVRSQGLVALLPIDLRLADAVAEPERLVPLQVAGMKALQLVERFIPS